MSNLESVGIGILCFLTQRVAEGHAEKRRVFEAKSPNIYKRFVNLLYGLTLQNTLARSGL